VLIGSEQVTARRDTAGKARASRGFDVHPWLSEATRTHAGDGRFASIAGFLTGPMHCFLACAVSTPSVFRMWGLFALDLAR
jgi:hypothetical protein